MRKQRILVDTYYLHVAQTGIKTYMQTFCEEAQTHMDLPFDYILSPSLEKVTSSSFFKGKTPRWKNWLFQLLYLSRKVFILPVLSHWYRADLVFSPDILSPIWGKGQRVAVIHDAFFWENPEHYHPIWLRVFKSLINLGLKSGVKIITISHYSKQKLENYLPLLGVDIQVVYPSSNVVTRGESPEGPNPVGSPYFLHVGVLEKRKNLGVLVKALSILIKDPEFSRYKLVLLGQRGPREAMDDYENILRLIDTLQLSDSVLLPGYVSREEINSYYRHASGYLFPSLNEGFGMPVLEAFYYRLPVIISGQGALQEIGGDAVISVGGNSAKDYASAMRSVITDDNLKEKLISTGLNRLELFRKDKFFLSLQDCFKKMLNGV